VHNEKDLELIVQSSRGSKEFTFLREAKIADVIATAAKTFGFSASDIFSHRARPRNPGQPLQAERTLVLISPLRWDRFSLTDVGSGV